MKKWYIKEFSVMTGVSMRGLRYYDSLGLIKPSLRLKNGYRLYSSVDLVRAQHVLAFKELGIELKDIKCLLYAHSDPLEQFKQQQLLLEKKQKQLESARKTLEVLIADMERYQEVSVHNVIKLMEIYMVSTANLKNYLEQAQQEQEIPAEKVKEILDTQYKVRMAAPLTEVEKEALKPLRSDEFKALSKELMKAMESSKQELENGTLSMEDYRQRIVEMNEKIKAMSYGSEEAMDLARRSANTFYKDMAVAKVQGILPDSEEMDAQISEYFKNNNMTDKEVVDAKDQYEAARNVPFMRAFLEDYTPGLVDYLTDCQMAFIEKRSK